MSEVSRREAFTILGASGVAATTILASTPQDALAQAASRGVPPTFTLLLVNDIYNMAGTDGRGGFARLAAIARAERAKSAPVLYVHAGDMFSPSLMSGFDQGAHTVELLNVVPPDVFVPGNHEFDFGPAVYATRCEQSKFPYFAANLRDEDGQPLPRHVDRRIVQLGPVKVGVFGVALQSTPLMANAGTLRFLDETAAVREQSKALRDEGADLVVAVTHTDFVRDLEIMRSRLVDVLLTGHDHDLRLVYDDKVVMAESGEEGQFITAIDMYVTETRDGGKRTLTWRPNFRVIDSTWVEPDPAAMEIIRRIEAELSSELDAVIARTSVDLDLLSSSVRSQETVIGNLMCDAMREATEADICITNGGSIRSNRAYPAGSAITRRDILSALPFGNRLVLVEITGRDIKDALENGVSLIDARAGRFPQIAGLAITIDAKAPVGSRIVTIERDGKPLDLGARFKVVANDFMLGGGDGYRSLQNGRVLIGKTDGVLMANAVMTHLRRLGTISIGLQGRITLR